MTELSPSQLVLAFFTLTSEEGKSYRRNLFTQIHNIVFHGKGGYDWGTVYSMPSWLRKFTFSEINKFYESENEKSQSKSPNQTTVIDSSGKVKTPNLLKTPTYK